MAVNRSIIRYISNFIVNNFHWQ